MKITSTILIFILLSFSSRAQIKILFDATKAETAGNADWVIDADAHNLGFGSGPAVVGGGNESNPQRIPTAAQSGITASTAETYWSGALSYWAIDCVKKGYQVETLPYNGVISYGNSSNSQDLSNYKIFVVVEPNIKFSASEKTAIINFVYNGGSLFMVSDHIVSDRNNDGFDSPQIWDDLLHNNGIVDNPFGIIFDSANISGSSSTLSTFANDSLLHNTTSGYGNVSQVLWSNGTTITINPTINSSVRAAVFKSGTSTTSKTNILVAYARYGLGKVVAFGDSSPFDDGTGDANDQLYDGYITDAAGNHQKLIMNATIWLATATPLPVELVSFNCIKQNNSININWTTATEINTSYFNIQRSINGKDFVTIDKVFAKGSGSYATVDEHLNNLQFITNQLYYRLEIVDNNGSKTYSEIKQLAIGNKQLSISVFPNPAKESIIIESNNASQIIIADITGKVCISKQIKSNEPIVLSVKTLNKGLYLVSVIFKNGETTTEKLLVE